RRPSPIAVAHFDSGDVSTIHLCSRDDRRLAAVGGSRRARRRRQAGRRGVDLGAAVSMPNRPDLVERLAAPGALRKVTQHVSLSDMPDKSDLSVARAWLVGALRNEDHRAGALALARLLREPLDQGLQRALAEEIELVARGKGHILKL